MKGKITVTTMIALLIITTLGAINTQASPQIENTKALYVDVDIHPINSTSFVITWSGPSGTMLDNVGIIATAELQVMYLDLDIVTEIHLDIVTEIHLLRNIIQYEGPMGGYAYGYISDIPDGAWHTVSASATLFCNYWSHEGSGVARGSDSWTRGEMDIINTQHMLTFTEQFDGVLKTYIQQLPNDVFKNNPDQRKNAFSEKIDEITEYAQNGEYQEVVNKLQNDIRAKMDGSVDGNPKNDWIVSPAVQRELVAVIDWALEGYQNMLTETAE